MDPISALVISVGMGIAAFLLRPKPKTPRAQFPKEFEIPQSENGVKIPCLIGTMKIVPNLVFYGNYNVDVETTGSKSSKQETATAYLSYLGVLCLGVVDQLLWIDADDVRIFEGPVDRGSDDVTSIDTKIGVIDFAWGTPTQTSNGYLQTTAGFPTSSAFRNVCHAVFRNCKLNEGFQVQRLEFGLRRVPVTPLSGAAEVGEGVNPAHALWDILTNRLAGSRYKANDLDVEAFNAIAETFEEEGVGCNFIVAESLRNLIESFAGEFDLVMRVRSGKLSPTLVRDNYDAEDVPVIDESNSTHMKRRREPGFDAPNDMVFLYANAARRGRLIPCRCLTWVP